MNTLQNLLGEEIKDLHSAEKQLTKAIQRMTRRSTDPALKEEFLVHLKETQGRAARLESWVGCCA